MQKIHGFGFYLTEPGKPLVERELLIDKLKIDDVVVEIAGCGLCHTDISFYSNEVRTKHPLPLILGHEISGKVIASGSTKHKTLVGKNVIVPAVLPCGECELCLAGRENICRHQQMPGNDFHGGFASHTVVPGRFLCTMPDCLNHYQVSDLCVIADAISTPYQAILRSHLKPNDLVIIVGVGGLGIYLLQYAKLAGARIIAIDIDDNKLLSARKQGAEHTLLAKDLNEKELRKQIISLVKEHQLPPYQWKVFETSGTASGQNTAFSLLSFAGTLGIVGFTMEKLSVRLSNLMAFDADVFGNWGCRPIHYQKILTDVLEGNIEVLPNIETHSLHSINEVIPQFVDHELEKRAVFVPNP